MARPIPLWGNPDSPTFYRDYVVMVSFVGKRIPWHKWAVVPLMAVEADIKASGTTYRFYDLQVYNNRNIKGTSIKSNHAWALAVDINPRENPWQRPLKTDIPVAVREAFIRHGFRWGGTYSTPDAMHFEYLGEPVKAGQEEDDMTPEQARQLKEVREDVKELREASAPKQSYGVAITNALLIGDKAKAKRLNDEFWQKWPQGDSGLPRGWSGG